jgi:hypothetical protein
LVSPKVEAAEEKRKKAKKVQTWMIFKGHTPNSSLHTDVVEIKKTPNIKGNKEA